MFRNLFQCVDILIVDATGKAAIKGFDNHDFGAFAVVYLSAPGVEHTVMIMHKENRMPTVYCALCQDSKNPVEFFTRGLLFKGRFATMNGKGELLIEFLYVGV